MKGRRHSPEQIVRKLREADRLLAEGSDVDAVCRQLEISIQTYQRWRSQLKAMRPEGVVRLKQLEKGERPLAAAVGRGAGQRHAEGGGAGKLVSPERRRRAVRHLQGRFRVSERRACRLTSQHRSSQRYQRRRLPDEALLRERLRLLARRHPRYGYRRVHALLRREGWSCNRKRVQRLWRDEGLRLPPRPRRRRRGKRMPGHVTATCPDQVWALDFLVDQTADGRPIKILTVTDEHTREALATRAARRLGADDTVETLERIVERRGQAPELIRCDNGPELVAHALRDWCRFAGVQTGYIEPGAPWQNPYLESFNGHLRRELLDLESFNTLYEAQLLIDDWQREYNHYRPHQSLNYQTPAEYARRSRTKRTETQPRPS